MKVEWVKPVIIDDAAGNTFGYATANARLKEEVKKHLEVVDEDGDIAVHFTTPMNFHPVPGKKNIIFTMFESPDITWHFVEAFEECDAVITCSQFCVDAFRKYTDKPIYLCPLGFDPEVFKFSEKSWRPMEGEAFRWLVVAAPNARKFSILDEIWKAFFRDLGPRVDLYFKTTGAELEETIEDFRAWGVDIDYADGVAKWGNWTIDNRRLPLEDLQKLYASAHGYLSLHMGEGYGLTTLEAMATGIPTVVTDWSGTKDFCDETNTFPVEATPGIGEVELGKGGQREVFWVTYAVPDLRQAMERITEVMVDYKTACKKAKKARNDIEGLTWEKSGKKLAEIINGI